MSNMHARRGWASMATTNYDSTPPPLPQAIACGVERGANVRGDLHGCNGGTG